MTTQSPFLSLFFLLLKSKVSILSQTRGYMGKITNRNVSKFLADTHTEMSAVYSQYPQYQSIVDAQAKHVLRENLYTARHPRLAGDFLTNKGLIFCLGFNPALKQGQHEYLLDAQQV